MLFRYPSQFGITNPAKEVVVHPTTSSMSNHPFHLKVGEIIAITFIVVVILFDRWDQVLQRFV
jgi:hypothetical protein